MEIEVIVQEICELAAEAAQDENTDPELADLIGRLVTEAKTSAPDGWQDEIEAVRSRLRSYLASLSVPHPLPPDKLNNLSNLKQRAVCADAIAQLGAAIDPPGR